MSSHSLRDEIKKRKTQATQQEAEQRRMARLRGDPLPTVPPTPTRSAPKPTVQPPASGSAKPNIVPLPRPTAQTLPPMSTLANPTRSSGKRLSPRQMRLLFGAMATFAMFLLAGIGVVVITSSSQVTIDPNLTLSPLPVVSARDVLTYFENAGVQVTNVREFAAPNDNFAGNAEIQFEVYRGQDKGLFVLVSYPSPQQRIPDLFKISASPRFGTWARTPASNVMMLSSPDTAPTLRDELSSRLIQYLVAPYRPHYPTSTPAVTQTVSS